MRRVIVLFSLVTGLVGCHDSSPTQPTEEACRRNFTADITVRNETSWNGEVLLDGGSIALLRPGESVSRTITAVTSHQLVLRELNCIFCSQCQWTVSLP